MSNFKLSKRSEERLSGVHADLVAVVKRCLLITPNDFTVLEGLRSLERQQELVDSGASTTMRSRHITGHAVDLAPLVKNEIRWDWPLYHILAGSMKQAAEDIGIPIEWGGDWKTFKDGPHFQLPWKEYPA